MIGAQMMEQGRLFGVEKFVAIGTVCSYPKFTPVPFRSRTSGSLSGRDQRALRARKEDADGPVGGYRQEYGFNSINLLPVNLYGPRDNFDLESSHVIPALIRKCLEAKRASAPSVTCWGTGRATREFLYVEDAAEAVVLAAERYGSSEPVNLGSGSEISTRSWPS